MIGPERNKYLFPSLFVCLFVCLFFLFNNLHLHHHHHLFINLDIKMNFTYRMQHVVLRGDLKKPLDL